jgi:probable HAF family extracellular repeat protein
LKGALPLLAPFSFVTPHFRRKLAQPVACFCGPIGRFKWVRKWYYGVAAPTNAFLNTTGSFSNTNYPNASYTEAWGINNTGAIVGFYAKTSGDGFHGYTNIKASFTSFDYPGSVNPVSAGATYPFAINDSGEITGYYVDANGQTHGFTNTNGTLMSFDYPGVNFTQAQGINNKGEIVGFLQVQPVDNTAS